MLPTKIYTITLAANASQRLLVSGQFFKIMAATGGVSITSTFGTLDSLIFGQGLENTPFDYLLLTDTSGVPNTVKILIGDQNFIDGLTGNMAILSNKVPQSSAFVNAQATVTNASAQLVAANTARQYLLIQNNSATGNIYVNFGAASTTANGVRISPGAAWELALCVSTQQIFAIGDIASNPNVLVTQG